ncbi:hypothetical protein JXA84_07335 [candidate division WOR-3 bacterium]|nr:hypothetical protein [candidate division WOR-3 bacterium]
MFDLKAFLTPYPKKGDRLLEINPCSKRIKLFTDMGFSVTGLDMNLDNLQLCQKLSPRALMKYGSLLFSPFGNHEKFDVIVFFGVLSGMMYDESKSFIYSVSSTLKEKGLAVFTLPKIGFHPPWWEEGELINYGRLACTPPYTGEVFCDYDMETIRKFMLDFTDINFQEVGNLIIAKAVKF